MKKLIHRSHIAGFLLMLSTAGLHAQNIAGYRYWFNDDVNAATVVDLPPTQVVDDELILNSNSLPPGHHLATIQFRDADGLWGAPWTSMFVQRSGTVNAIEYWFNDEIGNSITANLTPGSDPLITSPLNSAPLEVGFQTVTVRTMDAQGEYSVPHTVMMTRNGGMVSGYEYWIDDAIADRTIENIGPAGVVDLVDALPINTTEGSHLFTIRFRDADGGWSVPLSSTFSFTVGVDEIPGMSNYLLFPNPVNEQLSLRVDAASSSDLRIDVLDASGRTIQQFGSSNFSGVTHRNWDTSNLARGSYMLRISSDDHSLQIPFVKQ